MEGGWGQSLTEAQWFLACCIFLGTQDTLVEAKYQEQNIKN